MRICDVDKCEAEVYRRIWCRKHYNRWRKHGDPTITLVHKIYKNKAENNRAFYHKRRNAWIASQGGKCVKCGSVEKLQADHIDPKTKDPMLRLKATGIKWSRNQKWLTQELAKCQLLCALCHIKKTSEENDICGEKHGLSKLSEKDILEIRNLYNTGKYTMTYLAGKYNVSMPNISSIIKRKTWQHVK